MISSYIYSSHCATEIDTQTLNEIQQLAQLENKKHEITGYLTYKKNTFIQYIEGPKESLDQLISNLKKDDRHKLKKSFVLPIKDKRVFQNWSMRYIEYDDLIEIGFHELLETVFFTVDNRLFSDEETANKINRMLQKIAASKEV